MRTRKRSYSPSPPPPLFPICSSVCSSSSSSSSKIMENSDDFLVLLSNVCNGKDKTMGAPSDAHFWTNFSRKMKIMNKDKNWTAQSCEAFAKKLQDVQLAIEDPSRILEIRELTRSSSFDLFKQRLEKIFKDHKELFSSLDEVVAETPPPKKKAKVASTSNFTSLAISGSSSFLPRELEEGVLQVLTNLVDREMLYLRDVAEAQNYLSGSTWATKIFMQEEDDAKRVAMLIKARRT